MVYMRKLHGLVRWNVIDKLEQNVRMVKHGHGRRDEIGRLAVAEND